MSKYPITFNIYTSDGSGEASKDAPGEPWTAMYPGDQFRWYGSVPQVKAEIKSRIPGEVRFGDVVTA